MPAIKRNPLLAGAYWENFQGVKFNTVYVWRKGTKGTPQYPTTCPICMCNVRTVHDRKKSPRGAEKIHRIFNLHNMYCILVPMAWSVMDDGSICGLDGSLFNYIYREKFATGVKTTSCYLIAPTRQNCAHMLEHSSVVEPPHPYTEI